MSGAGRTICTGVHDQNKGQAGGRGQQADQPLPWLSGPISVWQVNGEHKTYLKATFTTWLIPLHCVISRCHISPLHVCLNALPSTLWLVSLSWLPHIHSSGTPHPFTSARVGGKLFAAPFLQVWFLIHVKAHTDRRSHPCLLADQRFIPHNANDVALVPEKQFTVTFPQPGKKK